MLQMTGMVVNLFTKEGGKDKEGKEYEPYPQSANLRRG